ncbi:MAG: uncharacterized protein JWL79_96 [Frankiales bacterium]|nr:uncharacterized protein [Frankiales bacterium]
MKKLLLSLLVLLVLLAVADRVAVHYVDRAVADRMQADGKLDARPVVDIKGFPFLTQAVRGHYDRTDVHIRDLTRSGVTISRLDVTVTGASIPLSKVGQATAVPVQAIHATAVLTYYELAHESGLAGLTVKAQGSQQVLVTGKIAGVSGSVTSTIALKGDRIVVSSLGGVLDFSVRIPALPYGLHLDSATAASDGIHLVASSGPTVLTPQ